MKARRTRHRLQYAHIGVHYTFEAYDMVDLLENYARSGDYDMRGVLIGGLDNRMLCNKYVGMYWEGADKYAVIRE